jgi:hypothetical protein
MTNYEFERVFLPDILRFVNLASVTYILDKSFSSENPPSTVKEAYNIASSYCLGNYYQSLPDYDRDEVSGDQAEYTMNEWIRRMRHMVLRYYKNSGKDVLWKDFEDIYLSGEVSKEDGV